MISSTLLPSLLLASSALAFPAMDPRIAGRYASSSSSGAPIGKRATFNAAAQRIDTSGAHAFVPPGPGDQRGPCPGLNALANSNYLPHNGIITLNQAIDATQSVFGMGRDLGGFLSLYATIIDGDPIAQTWSIGGSYTNLANLGGLLGQPQGLSGSHNKYESDASPGRGDAGLNNGDASSLNLQNFQNLYGLQPGDSGGNYDLGVLTKHAQTTIDFSRDNNPTFFWGPFTGVLVSQAAFTFIPAFMSNRTAENPEGYLDQEVLKTFFAVSGTQGNLKYTPGHERIPDNWYKRDVADPYTIPAFLADNLKVLSAVPKRLAVGGNLGTPGSFSGVDASNLTGGVFNSKTLLEGNNAACFAVENLLSALPDVLKPIFFNVQGLLGSLTAQLRAPFLSLNCPQLAFYNHDAFAKFPGAKGAAV